MTVEADFSDLGRLQTLLGGASNRVTAEMPKVLDAVADSVVSAMRENAPVDMGELRADIGVKERHGNQYERTRVVGSLLRQGWFQEVGTSRHPPQPWASPAAAAGERTLAAEMERLGAPW